MPTFQNTRIVPHAPQEMFDLVADVERYPDFLPLCKALEVRSRRERGEKTLLVADMTVAYKMVRETFTSQVLLKPAEKEIETKYIDGPFRYLDNLWRFEPAPEGCAVNFYIDYEFRSRTLGLLMGSMFDYAFRRFAAAFEERARIIYGEGAPSAP
ncbi:type II toxin-antitoxin system RatA family toxin [Aureimonas populi]|uniref:Type II toxin-antitoxin system RatA family toxin n=1 Tax=Aureimonas populi TaxID=1701758 RepID=A0ABW5CT29_9HYPH|nr:type II toxin-antitoxin system RatA family toxin [Aureimonas populi]